VSQPTKADYTKLSDTLQAALQNGVEYRKDIEYLRSAVADLKKEAEKARDQVTTLQTQNAILQANFADLTKRWDESDRRRWTVYGVMIAAGLSFVANLILLFLKR
jgi:hypothetical protein